MRACDMKYEDKPNLEDYKTSVRSISPQSYSKFAIPEYETRTKSITLEAASIKMCRLVLHRKPCLMKSLMNNTKRIAMHIFYILTMFTNFVLTFSVYLW
jgi:hypothetical protein